MARRATQRPDRAKRGHALTGPKTTLVTEFRANWSWCGPLLWSMFYDPRRVQGERARSSCIGGVAMSSKPNGSSIAPTLLDADQAAAFLGVGPRTFLELRRA